MDLLPSRLSDDTEREREAGQSKAAAARRGGAAGRRGRAARQMSASGKLRLALAS